MRGLLQVLLLGAMAGGLWALAQPRHYIASVTLFFPEIQDKLFDNLTKALKAGPDRLAGPVEAVGAPSSQVSEVAALVLQSEAARNYILEQSGASPQTVLEMRVASPQVSALRVELESRNDETARRQLQLCLDYYQEFVKKNSLSRAGYARRACDNRLAELVKRLRRLEDKMSRSSFADLRQLGDTAIKANPKVMSQLWIKRIEDEGSSRSLLDLMQRVRGSERKGSSEEAAWMADWGGGLRGPKPSRALARPVRRQDLVARAALERDYYETLLNFRSLVLQRSFLLTCESLESFDFQILDSIRVRSKPRTYWQALLKGMGLALLIWGVFALGRRRPTRKGIDS